MADKNEAIVEEAPEAVQLNGAGVEIGSQASLADIRKMEALAEQKPKGK